MRRIAIFISGEGSNALKMLEEFNSSRTVEVALVYSSKQNLKVQNACKEKGIEFQFLSWNLKTQEAIHGLCIKKDINWVVLAGFLKLIPESFIVSFPNRIVNIHPALLPKFGGKGMYGMHVHEAVIAANSSESGISIHFVNGAYDEGQIIAQFKVDLDPNETPETLSLKIRALEHEYFSETVAQLVQGDH
jgi:phosphoribosylglycinamide formyltransferase-1